MDNFRVRPLSETDIDAVITAAGGHRAHPNADRRDKPGADYLLAEALIDLEVDELVRLAIGHVLATLLEQ